MSHFDKAILEVLKHEGGYVNHPNDPGGETNFGITKRNYPSTDIKNLSKEQAIEIYKRDYWLSYLDELPYQIAAKLFDMIVNMGIRQAVKLAQRAAGVKDDGILGHDTIKGLQNTPVEKIVEQQKNFYKSLATSKPKLKVFLVGWLKRASWLPSSS